MTSRVVWVLIAEQRIVATGFCVFSYVTSLHGF